MVSKAESHRKVSGLMRGCLPKKSFKVGIRSLNHEQIYLYHGNRISFLQQSQDGQRMKYVCDVCGWEYDEEKGYPEGGIAPGTKWEDIPEDFECPLCFVGKDQFSEA